MQIAVDESEEDIIKDEAEKDNRGSSPMLAIVIILFAACTLSCILIFVIPVLINHFR